MSLSLTAPIFTGNGRPKGKGASILSSKCSKYSSISMLLNTSKSPTSPARLHRELQRLEPRIKSIESEVRSLRHLVPLGLKDMVESAKKDINSLQNLFSPKDEKEDTKEDTANNSNDEDTNNKAKMEELDKRLNELRERVFSRLESSFESSLNLIKEEKKIVEQKEAQNSVKVNSAKLFDLEEDYLDEVRQKIESSTQQITEKELRSNERIKSIQKNLEKLYDQYCISSKNDNESTSKRLSEISEDCNLHRSEISSIKDRIAEIKEKLTNKGKKKENSIHKEKVQLFEKTTTPTISRSQSQVPGQLEKIEELQNEAVAIKKEFQTSLDELKKEAEECENASQELTLAISSISSSTKTIQESSSEACRLTLELQDKVNDLASKVEQQEYKESLIAIVGQIKSTNEKIAEEIKEMKKKIILSNVENNDTEQKDEDAESEIPSDC